MSGSDDSTNRRKTSLSLSPAAAKLLARAKYELFNRFDIQASQSEILEVILLEHARNLDNLKKAILRRRSVNAA
jgi:hypothetical protein